MTSKRATFLNGGGEGERERKSLVHVCFWPAVARDPVRLLFPPCTWASRHPSTLAPARRSQPASLLTRRALSPTMACWTASRGAGAQDAKRPRRASGEGGGLPEVGCQGTVALFHPPAQIHLPTPTPAPPSRRSEQSSRAGNESIRTWLSHSRTVVAFGILPFSSSAFSGGTRPNMRLSGQALSA